MNVENQKTTGGPNPRIIEVPSTQKLSSVGIVEKPGITKINATLHQIIKRKKAEANVNSTLGGDNALIRSLENKKESWVLDFGASFHATS